jgi:xanthine dehydrogenase large subunit
VAAALGLPYHQVVCQVKRLGGGFGGKETQAAPFAVYAAMVAQQCQRPARLVLSKDDDMIMTGKRNPYRVDYRVGFAADGRILGLTVNLFGNGGAFADLSPAILERAMAHVDNAYYLPAVRIRGRVYRTHVHPHTAFRGFGAPKGIATIEEIMDRIAAQLNVDPLAIRLKNVYRDEPHNRTPYGQVVDNNILPDLFETLAARCDYRSRRESIQTYNRNAGDYLRGIALTPVKFGIAFNTRFLNQANALVIIHQDGTLQVATGAVEMGQGVNSRIARLIADCFGLPIEQIRMMPTATDKNANTSATAASSGTDLNGAAALKACHSLKVRLGSLLQQLQPIPEDRWAQNIGGLGLCEDITVDPDFDANRVVFKDGLVFLVGAPEFRVSFAKLVKEAYFHRIALSAYGHHRTPNLSFNKLTGQGRAFQYFTQGAACSEVEVNCWTGAVKVLQTDILMDAGRPINYEIDYGQVAGAFIQGMGWLTTEALYYDEQGKLLSHSPSTYKIAGIHDTPRTFHIEFVKNDGNTNNVGRTKALGEPPLLLALSVWAAIRDAISGPQAERREKGLKKLSIPATAEVILRQLWPDSFAQWEGSHDHD